MNIKYVLIRLEAYIQPVMQELMRLAGMNFTLIQIWKVSLNCTLSMHAKVYVVIMQTCQSN